MELSTIYLTVQEKEKTVKVRIIKKEKTEKRESKDFKIIIFDLEKLN